MSSKTSRTLFATEVMRYWEDHGRHDLPWRQTHDPYHILVSEMMLQQTQVERAIPFYERFLMRFPNAQALAHAPLAEVLTLWSGLGYNRRAKFLHDAAKVIVEKGMPQTAEELQKLPGVGPYTARAIAGFAYDSREIVIETNIRAALIHHFFPQSDKKSVADGELAPILETLLQLPQIQSARQWYSALMDYGAFIKKQHPNPSRKSKHHTVQPKFEGSLREVRGAILRTLKAQSHSEEDLAKATKFKPDRIRAALTGLQKDGLISRAGKKGREKWNLGV